MLVISSTAPYEAAELKALFSSVGWADGLSDRQLLAAMQHSSHAVTARVDGVLAGIVRSMDDGIWSATIDCMVVHAAYQRQGIAGAMLRALLRELSGIRYVSVSPNSSDTVPLYLKNGFSRIEDGSLLQLEHPQRGETA